MVSGLLQFKSSIIWRATRRVTSHALYQPILRFRARAAYIGGLTAVCQACCTNGIETCTMSPKVSQAFTMSAAFTIPQSTTFSRASTVSYARERRTGSSAKPRTLGGDSLEGRSHRCASASSTVKPKAHHREPTTEAVEFRPSISQGDLRHQRST